MASQVPFYLRNNPFAQTEQKGGPVEQKGATGNQGVEQKGASRINQVASRAIPPHSPHPNIGGNPSYSVNGAAPRYVAPISAVPQIGNVFSNAGQRPAMRPPVATAPRAPVGYDPNQKKI